MQKILVIQTAFIGDVVLATGILEKLHAYYPDTAIDIMVRKGNEALFAEHPFLHKVLIWDKKKSKYSNLCKLLLTVRKSSYDLVVNVQRFAATGLFTGFSGAKRTVGFDKNPFSFLFSDVIKHVVNTGDHGLHETERNHLLIRSFTDEKAARPRLYFSDMDVKAISSWTNRKFICIAPASVWFTKMFPAEQWKDFINSVPENISVYLLGAAGDIALCNNILLGIQHPSIHSFAGKLSFLESAALMHSAVMNFVNDSAPMHFASAVNASVAAIYCSTIPAFGFGPLSDTSHTIGVLQPLSCRPCGLHGKNACPQAHFHCAKWITTQQLLAVLPQ